MPIEIKELIIKGTIQEGASQIGVSNGIGGLSEEVKNDIISKTVEIVIQILEDKQNR